MAKKKKEKDAQSHLYKKEQILQSKKFENRKDLIEALLQNDELYTLEQIESEIKNFMKGGVM